MTQWEVCKTCQYNHISYCTKGSICEKVIKELTEKVRRLEAERTVYKDCVETVRKQTEQIQAMRDYIFELEAHIKEIENKNSEKKGEPFIFSTEAKEIMSKIKDGKYQGGT